MATRCMTPASMWPLPTSQNSITRWPLGPRIPMASMWAGTKWATARPAVECNFTPLRQESDQAMNHEQYDLHVHNNYIHDIRCDGINFATVDPSKGTVEAYDNLIVHTGMGPDPADGPAVYSGIYFAQILNAGSACSTNCGALVYNNTLYNNGSGGTPQSGQAGQCPESGTCGSDDHQQFDLSNRVRTISRYRRCGHGVRYEFVFRHRRAAERLHAFHECRSAVCGRLYRFPFADTEPSGWGRGGRQCRGIRSRWLRTREPHIAGGL